MKVVDKEAVFEESHRYVVQARRVMAEVLEGGFAYTSDMTRPFVATVTKNEPSAFPADATDDHFNRFVPALLTAQLVLRQSRSIEAAKRDAWIVHLAMQGFPDKKIASSILGIPETMVGSRETSKIKGYSGRVQTAFASNYAYTPGRFLQYFERCMAGDPSPIPFVARPSFAVRHKR